MDVKKITTNCCIVGGGPAGIMLGFLLARAGVETFILEQWPDFFRDFRGDTIHPSTLELLYELDLLEKFLQLPLNKTYQISAEIGGHHAIIADFSHLKVHCPFLAFIPQWDFLNFISSQAQQYPNFHLLMHTKAVDLIEENNRVIGIRATSPTEELEIKANLIVGSDGRHSLVREKSGLPVKSFGVPMDVLWFRLSRQESDIKQSLGKMDLGHMLVMIERGDYWQCGFLIRKGEFEHIRDRGIDALRQNIIKVAPEMSERIQEINSWDQVKLLTVCIDHLTQWYKPGLLCIGDAAHAMSPIGGVGINLAIQDAVATANILTPDLLTHEVSVHALAAVQKRRELPATVIQHIQMLIQNRVIDRVLDNPVHPQLPFLLKLLQQFPYLRRIPAYLVGIGLRPEHIKK